jgi:ABC-type dipeptide/oligopeptide/nickel transport system permease subunit
VAEYRKLRKLAEADDLQTFLVAVNALEVVRAHQCADTQHTLGGIGVASHETMRRPTIVPGGGLLAIMGLIAVLAPYLVTVDPTALLPARRTREPFARYWFGTNMLERDVYLRVLYGARISLIVGFSVAFLASAIGLAI